jgi:hypothetical protein
MGTTRRYSLGIESTVRSGAGPRTRPAVSLPLILAMALAGCSSAAPARRNGTGGTGDTGGRGGTGDTGGSGGTGGTSGTGGNGASGGQGGAGGGGAGGSQERDAAVAAPQDSGSNADPADGSTGTAPDARSAPSGDGAAAVPRPDAMGQGCKSAQNEAFTVTAFDQPYTGVFTAWFTATPSIAPTNSVVGLSDGDVGPGSGDTPLHNLHQILLRFAASGTLDARNGATYSSDTVIKYQAIPYDFRLVVDVPNKKYAAYVSWQGQPEVTIGTNLAFRDSARVPTKFDHWAVQSVAQKTTVCGFITRGN